MNVIETQNLAHSFRRARQSAPHVALNKINLSIHANEIFGILGPNGGGKTTLFRILSTAIFPLTGSATVFGFDVAKNPQAVREKIGVIFQYPSLDKKLTLKENLTHQGHLYGLSGSELEERRTMALTRLGLLDRQNDIVEHLSGGMQRRGEIAKGILHEPQLLLMDEPSSGLDPNARRDMWNYLNELKLKGMTIVLTTHLMDEADKCDRLAILHEGQLKTVGTPNELKARIGGDVISIQTSDPHNLVDKIKTKFGGPVSVVDEVVRLEKDAGHKIIPQIVEAFPGLVQAITVGKPNLEDVFIHETGHGFSENSVNYS